MSMKSRLFLVLLGAFVIYKATVPVYGMFFPDPEAFQEAVVSTGKAEHKAYSARKFDQLRLGNMDEFLSDASADLRHYFQTEAGLEAMTAALQDLEIERDVIVQYQWRYIGSNVLGVDGDDSVTNVTVVRQYYSPDGIAVVTIDWSVAGAGVEMTGFHAVILNQPLEVLNKVDLGTFVSVTGAKILYTTMLPIALFFVIAWILRTPAVRGAKIWILLLLVGNFAIIPRLGPEGDMEGVRLQWHPLRGALSRSSPYLPLSADLYVPLGLIAFGLSRVRRKKTAGEAPASE